MTSEKMCLEVFQDLSLSGPENNLTLLREALLNHTVAPWRRRAEEREKQPPKGPENDSDILTFQREPSDNLPGATLFLLSRPDGYKVSNIVPLEIGELGYSKYNTILQDFEQKIAMPAATQAGFEVKTTSDRQSIDDWVPPKVAEALRLFSTFANKSTGSAHPADRKRWFKFLVEAHAAHAELGTDYLVRWLAEVEGWDDDHATALAIEYEFGLDLLSEYDHYQPF